jgi:hypothetical protein
LCKVSISQKSRPELLADIPNLLINSVKNGLACTCPLIRNTNKQEKQFYNASARITLTFLLPWASSIHYSAKLFKENPEL